MRKCCAVLCLVAQSCLTLYDPVDCTAHQAPLSTGCSTKEYWSGLPCLPTGDLPETGIKPASLMSPDLIGGKPQQWFLTEINFVPQGQL